MDFLELHLQVMENKIKIVDLFNMDLENKEYISECTCLEAIEKKYINIFKIKIYQVSEDTDIFEYTNKITLQTIEERKK